MKKLLAIALTLAAATAFATEEEVSDHEYCKTLSGLAESIMTRRQEGVSVVTLMEMADLPVSRFLIEEAYSSPRFSSPKYQERAISKFRDDYYIICLKAQGK